MYPRKIAKSFWFKDISRRVSKGKSKYVATRRHCGFYRRHHFLGLNNMPTQLRLDKLLVTLSTASLKVKRDKCSFFYKHLNSKFVTKLKERVYTRWINT